MSLGLHFGKLVSAAVLACAIVAPGTEAAVATSPLTVTKSGSGSGTVSADSGLLVCGVVCSAPYPNGTVVTLTAAPAAGSAFTGWLGPCTGTGTCVVTVNAAKSVSATFAAGYNGTMTLDIDGSKTCDALTDGLLALRYLFGLTGPSLINGSVAAGASRSTTVAITNYLNDIRPALDVDGNGQVDALTDGLMILRYLFGLRGASLMSNAVGAGATRTLAADIELQLTRSCNPLPATTTVFTILMENHDYSEIVGSPNAPYINSLIATYGLATNYQDITHPSLPNYLYLISGNVQGATGIDIDPTAGQFPVASENLGNQMHTAGIPWRSYQESMTTACQLSGSGNYAPRHNPFIYFSDIQSAPGGYCASVIRDYSEFAADLAAGTYRYMWITPNLLDDGHDPSNDPVTALKTTDAWLSTEIPKILASDAYKNGGVIFLTWDEAEARNGDNADQVPMIVISPKIKAAGFKSATLHDHGSYLATVQDIYGLPRISGSVGASNLLEFFAP